MRELVLILFFLLFVSTTYAESNDLSKAIGLISYNNYDDAFVHLEKVLSEKGQEENRLKALMLLVSYPIGSAAYLKRDIYSQEIFQNKKYWSSIREDEKRIVLLTYGLSSFSKKIWKNAEVAFSLLTELTANKFPEEYSMAQSHLGWISVNKKQNPEALARWCNEFKKNSIHDDWKSIIAKDLGAIWVESLYTDENKKLGANNNCILELMQGDEKESFRDGFILGFQRTNQVWNKMTLIAKELQAVPLFQNFFIESDLNHKELADGHPCYFLNVITDQFKIKSDLNDLFIKRLEKCWSVIQIDQLSKFAAVSSKVKNLPEKIYAEINERNGNYELACNLAIQIQEKTLAVRSCLSWISSSIDKKKSANYLKDKLGELIWIELWDQVFQAQTDNALKFEWLYQNFKNVEETYNFSKKENEIRPLYWWIELCASGNEHCANWENEILNANSQLWSLATMKCESKYPQILALSLRTKKYDILFSELGSIEKCIKRDKNLEALFFVWLDSYWNEQYENAVTNLKSKYFTQWQTANLVIRQNVKLNMIDLKTSIGKLNKIGNLPSAALIVGKSTEFIKQSLNVSVNMNSPYFVNQLTKKISLLKKGIDLLQKNTNKLSHYQTEVEGLRQDSLRETIVSLETLAPASSWTATEIELWENQRQKIIASLKESL